MVAKILSGFIGALMLLNCLWWISDPTTAAKELAMPLLEGLGGDSQIGDFAAFFFTAGLFACIGAYRAEYIWLYTTISLLGSAAIFRSYAAMVHGSEPLMEAIGFEVVMSAALIICVFILKKTNEKTLF